MKPFPLIPGAVAVCLAAYPALHAQDDGSSSTASPPVEIPSPGGQPEPETVKTDASYGLGYRTGGQFGRDYGNFGIKLDDLDMDTFVEGFLDGFRGDEPEVSEQALGTAMQALGDMLQQREQKIAAENLETGREFLEANAEKEDVRTTESGLQYQVIEPGGDETYVEPEEGEPAKQFLVEYRGTLIDGTEFDASPDDQSIPMDLNVIEGIREALTSMPVGAKWKVFIPSDLAYGEERRSADIGPNAALIFELELKAIEDAPPAAGGGLPFPMPQGQ